MGLFDFFRGSSAQQHAARATSLNGEGQFERALQEAEEAIRLDPNLGQGYCARAFALFQRGFFTSDPAAFRQAIADFTEVLRLEPTRWDAFHGRAQTHLQLGQPREAIVDLTHALECSASHGRDARDSLSLRGQAQQRVGDHARAIADFSRAIELDPGQPDLWVQRARSRGEIGDLEGALVDHSEAIRLDPTFRPAYQYRAILHEVQARMDQALADYTEAIRLDPDDPGGYENRAKAYRALGDDGRAEADEKRARELGGPR
jgi:tetratricopeptide (TPR) repeat protein